LDICRTEPPLLQILIRRELVEPGATDPKSMMGMASFVTSVHPPSEVLMDIFAIGAVEALPSKMVFVLPPVDQIWK